MEILRLETVNSTNIYAKSHIADLGDKSVVHALHQSHGRGRLNRSWIDLGKGNLFFSIILKPSQHFHSVYSNLTQYACLKLAELFEKYGVNAKIKWPNDIMIDGQRKISGILSETVMTSGKLEGIVIGIGINLNAKQADVDKVQDRVATALNLETGEKVNSEIFLQKYLTTFFAGYEEFLNLGFESIKQDYIKRNCFLDKDLEVNVLNNIKSGFAKGITSDGELILQNNNEEFVLTIGDIL